MNTKKNERKSWDETFLNNFDLQHKIRRSEQEKNREKISLNRNFLLLQKMKENFLTAIHKKK